MRIIPICLAVILGLASAEAAPQAAAYDVGGERFTRAFQAPPDGAPRLIEFTRPGETVETWTKLLAFHYYPADGRRPEEATNALAHLADARYPGAGALLTENAATSEAIVEFQARAPRSPVVEVNVFKYAPGPDGKGLVAVQFAIRVRTPEAGAAKIAALRAQAVDDIKVFDMAQVRAHLARKV